MKKKIIMLRHAESIGNAGGATIDSASMGLSELGIAQAQELPTAIGVVPEILIYSKYLRAEQTADPLRRTHPHSVCSVWEIHEFTYLNGMKYKNTTQKQRQFPRQEYWSRCDPMYCDEGGAESFYDFLRRVDVYIRRLQTIY